MDGYIRIGTEIDQKSFDKQIAKLEEKLNDIRNSLQMASKDKTLFSTTEISQMEAEAEKLKNQIISLQERQNKTSPNAFNFKGLIKDAKKLILGIVGIRSAYMLARKASSAWLSTDEQKSKEMEANWIGLGAIFSSLIEGIMASLRKLITSVLYLMSKLTGVNYIEKANTAILNKQKKATNDLTKANNKLIASFDEMNVLGSNNSASSSAIDTSVLFDVSTLGESTIKTIEKIAEKLQPVYNIIKDIVKWCLDHPSSILIILGGTLLLNTISKIIGIAGVGGAAGTGLMGLLGVLGQLAVVGVVTAGVIWVADEVDKSNKNAQDFANSMDKITSSYDEMIKTITGEIDTNPTKEAFDKLIYLYKTKKGVLETEIESLKKNLTWYNWIIDPAAYYDTKDKIKELEKELHNTNEEIKLIEGQANTTNQEVHEDITETNDLLKQTFKEKYTLNIDEKNVDNTLNDLKDVSNVITNLKKNNTATIKVNSDTSGFKSGINNLFTSLTSKLNAIGFKIPTIKLAKGGIVNNPGRGVALGGEGGPEGVIPLTDAQQMALLGEAIGKYITVNANITNTMNGRIISRELQKIQNENDFALNR